MQQKERLIILIEKYQDGTCTDAERQELEQWYTSYNHEATLEELLNEKEQGELKDELLAAIRQEILEKEQSPVPMPVPRKHMLGFWRSVAAVLLCTGLSYAMYKWLHTPVKTSPEVLFVEVVTPKGKTMEMVLPDSSKVWLNAGSKLKYAKHFDNKMREVYLDGEAFFDVKQEANRSFIVYSGEVATQVLGTSFNVSNYPGNEVVAVTVLQGKVRVAQREKELGIVLPDQQVSYNTLTGTVMHEKINAAELSSWKDGWLIFKEQSFQDIAAQLQRKFDITIEINDPALARCRFTASFAPNTNLAKVLNLLCKINHSDYQLMSDVNKVIIKGKGCK